MKRPGMQTLEQMKTGEYDYDWQYAFGYATGFGLDDVAEVIAAMIGFGDYAETDVVGLFRLKDGRYATLHASCDTTGWDCRSGGTGSVFPTRDEAIRMGLTPEDRVDLGLELAL